MDAQIRNFIFSSFLEIIMMQVSFIQLSIYMT